MGGGQPAKVFISSTSEDLKSHREAARDAALAAGMLPIMMEYFAANGERPPLPACLTKVSDTQVLVVIVAHRYGWVPPGQEDDRHKSITWLECEQAVSDGKEVLAFLVDEKHAWPEAAREPYRLTEAMQNGSANEVLFREVNRNVALLKEFKAWLNARGIRAAFTTPEDLRRCVAEALYDWRQRHLDIGSAVPLPADPSRYLLDLLDKTAYIDIRGLSVGTGQAHRFPIEQLFMSLTTAVGPKAEGRRGKLRDHDAKTDMEQHGSVLLQQAMQNDRLIIVGDPGSGKTTFVRRVAHALCETELGGVPQAARDRLGILDRTFPVLVRLSELAQHLANENHSVPPPGASDAATWLPHYLGVTSLDNGCSIGIDFFRQQLEAGVCTILLDGMDEAPDRMMRQRISRLIQNAERAYRGCRFVVTSRPATYIGEAVLPGFVQATISPLPDEMVVKFLTEWCAALYGERGDASRAHLTELLEAVRARPEIHRMARNPVMLTALAVVHWNERRLPEQRADLYNSIITWLARSREQRKGRATADETIGVLQELALAMQDDKGGRKRQASKRWGAETIATKVMKVAGKSGEVTGDWVALAQRFLDEEEVDSGIIVGRGADITFWHLTFQEFLAAKAIASRLDAQQRKILFADPEKIYLPEWREVILLFAGILHEQGTDKVDGFVCAVLDGLAPDATLAKKARCAGLLGSLLRDLEPVKYQITDGRYQSLLDTVIAIFDREKSRTVQIEIRIEAADALGQVGDHRLDFRRDDYWVTIPAGNSVMGAQGQDPNKPSYSRDAKERESPVHEVYLDEFRIARYPVTVGQYRQFIDDEGYEDERWWTAGGFRGFSAPDAWDSQLQYPSRPVVGVSWWEAAAFCAWAGVRLPSEAEWERAAGGTEGRKYPWGDEPIDEKRANFASGPSQPNVGHPTPVGIYPPGNTRDEICDMAGNVWEWCEDWFGEYPPGSVSNPHGPPEATYRVIRGGCFGIGSESCRSVFRDADEPGHRNRSLGFRAAADLSPQVRNSS